MSKKKITAAADQAEKIMRTMAKRPGRLTVVEIADLIGAASVSSLKNRLTAMRQHGLVIDAGSVRTGTSHVRSYQLAGELKTLLIKNRKDAADRLKTHYAQVKGKIAEKVVADQGALAGKVFDKEDYPAGMAGEQLAGGGYVEKTPAGRVFRLEAFRRPARDCIGDKPRGACGVSSLGCEYIIGLLPR